MRLHNKVSRGETSNGEWILFLAGVCGGDAVRAPSGISLSLSLPLFDKRRTVVGRFSFRGLLLRSSFSFRGEQRWERALPLGYVPFPEYYPGKRKRAVAGSRASSFSHGRWRQSARRCLPVRRAAELYHFIDIVSIERERAREPRNETMPAWESRMRSCDYWRKAIELSSFVVQSLSLSLSLSFSLSLSLSNNWNFHSNAQH